MSASPVEDIIAQKLNASFKPQLLAIINESGRHQGHSHHHGGVPEETGETHFRVKMTAAAFRGLSPQQRHRAVYQALADELQSGVHALALELKAPGEE